MKTLIVLIILALSALMMWFAVRAEAHDWYAQRSDPQTSSRCCGGQDCAPVPLDADWVNPARDGFRITMSLEQTRLVNANSQGAINEMVPWSRVQTPPIEANNSVPALYHICISAYPQEGRTRIYCLFAVPSL